MRFRELERTTFDKVQIMQDCWFPHGEDPVGGMVNLFKCYKSGHHIVTSAVPWIGRKRHFIINDQQPVWVVKPKRKRGRSDN